jgi:hypothetical protein
MDIHPFCDKRPHALLRAGLCAACGEITKSDIPNCLKLLCNFYDTVYFLTGIGLTPGGSSMWSIYLLIILNTLLLRPSLHFTELHFTQLHYTCRHFTSSHLSFTYLHFTTLSFGLTPSKFPTALFHVASLHFTSLHFIALLFTLLHKNNFKMWRVSA